MRFSVRVVTSLVGFLLMAMFAGPVLARTTIVFAPHPDDEALLSSGVIYAARLRGDIVKVVVATNGDCNANSTPHVRELETMAAMRDVLGVSESDIIFLGYPDCGLKRIYNNYISPTSVYTSQAGFTETYAYEGLGHTDYHRYLTGSSASYNKPNMLGDIKDLLRRYSARDVYVTSGYDDNPDHYALYFFVVEAILDLMKEDPLFQPSLYEGIVHPACEWCLYPPYRWPYSPDAVNQYPAISFAPDQVFPEPPYLYTTPLRWTDARSIEVPLAMQDPDPALNLKYQALSRYQTQTSGFFYAFVRKNEVFWERDLFQNLALQASARASSERVIDGALASKVNDGFVMGRPKKYDGEWASNYQLAGAWVQLDWAAPQVMNRVILHDRVNPDDNVLAGTLTFSDGTSLAVGALANNGNGLSIDFPMKLVTWVRLTIDNAVGYEAGLAEMEVYLVADPGDTLPEIGSGPTADPGTITDLQTSSVSVIATDRDGDPLTYFWSATGGTVSGTGATVVYTPPRVTATTVYRADVMVVDGRGGWVTGSVNITVDPAPNAAPQIEAGPTASPAAITDIQTSSLNVVTTDANGDVMSYSWSATGGTVTGSGTSVTYTPPRVTVTTVYQVTVTVMDGLGGSVVGTVDITVTASGLPLNVARSTTATASTQRTNQGAAKAIDGVVSGYPVDSTKEWATVGQTAGAWITLTWSAPQMISRVVLHDRINTSDRIMGGVLSFSDGTSIVVGALPNDGSGYGVNFSAKTVTSVTLQINSAQGSNVGLAEFEVFDILEASVNAAPQITAGPTASPGTITMAQTSALSVTASDGDGDVLSYSWSATGGTVAGTGATAVYTPPTVTTTTAYRVDAVVTDGRGGSATGSVNITVTPPNTAPQITLGPAASPGTITDVETSSLSVTATDADGDALTYGWMTTGGTVTGVGAAVTYAPPRVTVTTVYQVTVTVSDGRGGSTTGSVDVTVIPSGLPLNVARSTTATASTQRTNQGAAKAIDGVVSGYPVDSTKEWATVGQTAGAWITLTWSGPQMISRVVLHDRINTTDRVMGGTLNFSDGTSIVVGALPNDGAPYGVSFATKTVTFVTLQVTAAQGSNVGLAEFEVFDRLEEAVNVAPTITAGPTAAPGSITMEQTSALSVTASDADGDVLSYSWSATGGTVTGTGATAVYTPPVVSVTTVYQIDVVVSDGRGGSATGSINVTVTPPNRAPQITAGPTASSGTITDVETSSVGVTATDADGDALSYSWTTTGGVVTGTGASGTYTPPRVTVTTVYQVTVTVSDGRGGSTSGSVDVTVTPSGLPINIAGTAVATASTQRTNQGAAKAIDGVVSGYPVDSTKEWATVGQTAGAWITLTWSVPQTLSRIVLHDRINTEDRITGGTLQFSDGSTLAVGALPNDGSAYVLDFPAKTVTSVTLQVTAARGSNIGLAEFEVY